MLKVLSIFMVKFYCEHNINIVGVFIKCTYCKKIVDCNTRNKNISKCFAIFIKDKPPERSIDTISHWWYCKKSP